MSFKPPVTMLVDGDVVVYRVAHSTEDPEVAVERVWDIFQSMANFLGATNFVVALSCTSHKNFRREIDPTYKLNRKDVQRPKLYSYIKRHLWEDYSAIMVPTLEADDVLSILANKPHEGTRIICSIDKDFKSTPCYYFNPWKPKDGVWLMDELTAFKNLMTQTLTGDSVDGYKGCKGIGPVRANKALRGATSKREMWDIVVQLFKYNGMTEEDALTNARMAFLLLPENYNKETKRVKHWEPPKLGE